MSRSLAVRNRLVVSAITTVFALMPVSFTSAEVLRMWRIDWKDGKRSTVPIDLDKKDGAIVVRSSSDYLIECRPDVTVAAASYNNVNTSCSISVAEYGADDNGSGDREITSDTGADWGDNGIPALITFVPKRGRYYVLGSSGDAGHIKIR